MRLLADENIPGPIVRRLRVDGHDVVYVAEVGHGEEDPEVLDRAGRGGRLLLTEDRDFGQLVYLQQRPAAPGVVYLRLGDVPLQVSVDAVAQVLSSGLVLEGQFTIVSGTGRVRQRPLPPRPEET